MGRIFLIICLINSFSGSKSCIAQAQEDTSYYRIETLDGNIFIGAIIEESDEYLKLNTENLGEITILKKNIRSRTPINLSRVKDGIFWFDNPQSTRYFWQPNGYGLNKGEGYYQNVWIFVNQAHYGIADNFSFGVGILPAFFFGGAPTPVWITPKVSIPIVENKFNVGAGALFGTILSEPESGFGILYGSSTFGSRDKNLSVGLGWTYAGGTGLGDSPTISISGMIRTGAKGYFLSENYYIGIADGSNVVLLSLGGRQIIRRIGLDYGAIIPFATDMDFFLLIPWLGITVPFGNVVETRSTMGR